MAEIPVKTSWFDKLTSGLKMAYSIPCVESSILLAQNKENKEKTISDIILYVFTPKSLDIYKVAEAVEDSIKHPKKTIFCVLDDVDGVRFTEEQTITLKKISMLIARNGGMVFDNREDVVDYLNYRDRAKI